jgi:hypothetical protein
VGAELRLVEKGVGSSDSSSSGSISEEGLEEGVWSLHLQPVARRLVLTDRPSPEPAPAPVLWTPSLLSFGWPAAALPDVAAGIVAQQALWRMTRREQRHRLRPWRGGVGGGSGGSGGDGNGNRTKARPTRVPTIRPTAPVRTCVGWLQTGGCNPEG